MDIEDMGIEEYDFYDDPSEDDDIDWYNLLEIEYLRENWLDERADDWTSRRSEGVV